MRPMTTTDSTGGIQRMSSAIAIKNSKTTRGTSSIHVGGGSSHTKHAFGDRNRSESNMNGLSQPRLSASITPYNNRNESHTLKNYATQ